ncbi:MAG: hypothetical protein L0387_19955 [Acidobacteria bacterium]|nr:hypothetical protein [Acidobacteriota bacterium]MCI0722731.1 hypothetical protein [Acidobacteriota bacterium]
MRNTLSWAGLLIFLLAADSAFAETDPTKPARTKRVFTNDDLSKFGEKYGSDAAPTQIPSPNNTNTTSTAKPSEKAASEPKIPASEQQAYWVGKLKQAETTLQKAKADQAKYAGALEKFEQKRRDAQTDFQKNLSQNQVADSLKNLARASEEVKQAEKKKAKLLADMAQKGFKLEELGKGPEASGQQE